MKVKAQTLIEYAVLFGCMVMALVGMQIYLKRGISGGIRSSSDMLGRQFDPDADFTDSSITTRNTGDSITEVVVRKETGDDSQERFFTDTYTVSGPGGLRDEAGNLIIDSAGNPVIPEDSTRQPVRTITSGRETIKPDRSGRLFD